MDEASKATPPELALPVIYGKKAIIVGDHRQLPPLVDGNEIKETLISIGENRLAKTLSRQEFDKSQFENLFENIDTSIKGTFDTQYRMHPAINNVIAQFYSKDGGLNCGLPIEEEFHSSFEEPMSRFHGLKFNNILTPETHVLWINVDTPEVKEGTSRVNFGEVEAINNILEGIKKSNGFQEFKNWLEPQTKEEKQIGLISFYGKQIRYLDRMIKNNHEDIPIRLSTVDRFQGMERNIIIVSMVRSNKIATSKEQMPDYELYDKLGYPKQDSLGFAEFPNRLNVALSRARRLLIIVGNKDHFCKKEIYKNVFDEISASKHGRIIEAKELIINE
jgi:superfamily I DNA and/or RNA helicase